jgi:hypothetical protein
LYLHQQAQRDQRQNISPPNVSPRFLCSALHPTPRIEYSVHPRLHLFVALRLGIVGRAVRLPALHTMPA